MLRYKSMHVFAYVYQYRQLLKLIIADFDKFNTCLKFSLTFIEQPTKQILTRDNCIVYIAQGILYFY